MSWNGSGNRTDSQSTKRERAKTSASPRQNNRRFLFAGVVVLLIGGLVTCLMFGKLKSAIPDKPIANPIAKSITEKKSGRIASVKHIVPTNCIEKTYAPKRQIPKFEKRPGALQLPDGRVLTFRPPKEGCIKTVYSHGRVFECDHLGNFKEVTKRQLFDTAFEENFLALAAGNKSFIPAFLTGLDESDVKKLLTKDYVMKGDETEEEKQRLKSYYDLKCSVLLYMEQGGTFADFIKDVNDFNAQERAARALCMSEVITLYKEGRYEDARLTLEAANKITEDKGYRPIKLPEHINNAIGIE